MLPPVPVEIPVHIQNGLKKFFSHQDANKRFVQIYSAGKLTQAALSSGLIDPARIRAIFDRNKEYQGKTIAGIPVVSPEDIALYKDSTILILSNRCNAEIYAELKPICDASNISLVDVCSEPYEINFNELQHYYRDEGLYSAFEQLSGRKYLWHVALPKSGSTWLTTVMRHIYLNRGWQVDVLTRAVGVQKQEIDPRYFFTKGGAAENVFFQHQHCNYSAHTRNLIVRSGARCIVQLRGIFDVVVSIHDYIRKLVQSNDPEAKILPIGTEHWNDQYLFDFIIDVMLPWHIGFVKDWISSDLVEYGIVTFLRYEDLVVAPANEIMKITNWAGLDVTEKEIVDALELANSAFTRKNIGQIGRGSMLLSTDQKTRIQRLAAYHFSDVEQLKSVL